MKTQITKDNIKRIFEQKVRELMTQPSSFTVINSLQLVIEFYKNYEITDVDTTVPDNDMLLFEYGIYNWQDGKGENFTISLTRQFYLENEMSDGFSQLRLILYFDCEEFRQIVSLNKWSIDFENIEDWKIYVTNTDGFKHAEDKTPKSFDIFLSETD